MFAHSYEVLGSNRNNPMRQGADKTKIEIYVDLWANENNNLIAAMDTARDALHVSLEVEQVEGMTCISVEGLPNDLLLFKSRLANEGIHIATTKYR